MTASIHHRISPIAIGACVLGLLGIIALGGWMTRSESAPRLNADTVTLANFVATDAYAKLPFERQDQYMKVLEDREDAGEFKRAYQSGKLSEAAYRAAIQEAWLGEQLKRSEKYAVLPPGSARSRFLAELIERKEKGKKPKAETARSSPAPKVDDDDNDAASIKRDASVSQARMAGWPGPVREQVERFRRDYDEAREAHRAATGSQAAGTDDDA